MGTVSSVRFRRRLTIMDTRAAIEIPFRCGSRSIAAHTGTLLALAVALALALAFAACRHGGPPPSSPSSSPALVRYDPDRGIAVPTCPPAPLPELERAWSRTISGRGSTRSKE
jgi:hypothetical protein